MFRVNSNTRVATTDRAVYRQDVEQHDDQTARIGFIGRHRLNFAFEQIYDRLYKDGKEHLKRSLTREKANPTGCTFKPAIRGTGSRGEKKSGQSEDRFSSLYEDSKIRLQRRDEAYAQIPAQCTFQPDISLSNENGMGENADR